MKKPLIFLKLHSINFFWLIIFQLPFSSENLLGATIPKSEQQEKDIFFVSLSLSFWSTKNYQITSIAL